VGVGGAGDGVAFGARVGDGVDVGGTEVGDGVAVGARAGRGGSGVGGANTMPAQARAARASLRKSNLEVGFAVLIFSKTSAQYRFMA